MDHLFYRRYLALEESEGVGIGHHHGSDVLAPDGVEQRLECLHVDSAVGERLHLDDVETAYRGRGRVGAVGRVGHDDQTALVVAAALVVLLDDHQARQLAMSTGEGLQRESMQARQLAQRAAEQRADGLSTAHGLGGLQRVEVLELRQGRHLLVELRVVLHRARPQRIEAVVHTEVVGRQVSIVAHHRHLVALGQLGVLCTPHAGRHLVAAKAVLGQRIAATALLRELKYQVSV